MTRDRHSYLPRDASLMRGQLFSRPPKNWANLSTTLLDNQHSASSSVQVAAMYPLCQESRRTDYNTPTPAPSAAGEVSCGEIVSQPFYPSISHRMRSLRVKAYREKRWTVRLGFSWMILTGYIASTSARSEHRQLNTEITRRHRGCILMRQNLGCVAVAPCNLTRFVLTTDSFAWLDYCLLSCKAHVRARNRSLASCAPWTSHVIIDAHRCPHQSHSVFPPPSARNAPSWRFA